MTFPAKDRAVIEACLQRVAVGDVILHDWEFATVMGVSVPEFLMVLAAWPDVDETNQTVRLSVGNAMNNLLGYPHAWHERWQEMLPFSRDEVRHVLMRVLVQWRNGTEDNAPGDFETKRDGLM